MLILSVRPYGLLCFTPCNTAVTVALD
jgi:hypothetical protein